jgi:hypothetical protein
MQLLRRVIRGALSLVFVLLAGACIVRGLRDLFAGSPIPTPGGSAAGFDGMLPALAYFVLGVTCLWAAGAVLPSSSSDAEPTEGERPADD